MSEKCPKSISLLAFWKKVVIGKKDMKYSMFFVSIYGHKIKLSKIQHFCHILCKLGTF